MPTSSAVNARAASRAESRMLIDGELREAQSGARFDNLSRAIGAVLGSTAAATAHDGSTATGACSTGPTRRTADTRPAGIGRQNGIEGFEQYLETKTIGYR